MWLLLLAGGLIQLSLLGMVGIGDLRLHVPEFLALYALAFSGYLLALALLRGFRKGEAFRAAAIPTDQVDRRFLLLGLTFALLFRLTLVGTPPSLSEDIYRYIWDGRVAAQGVNPYLYAPQAEELADLRDAQIYPRINHPHIPTIYPPAAQFFFFGMYLLAPGTLPMKLALVLFDLVTVALIYVLLQRLSRPREWLLIYAWNPLLIVEVAGSGHMDSLGIMLLVGGLVLFLSKRSFAGTTLLALSTLAKLLPALFLPFLLPRRKSGRTRVHSLARGGAAVILFAAVVLLGYLPFAGADSGLFSALQTYASKWRFNDSAFALVFETVRAMVPDQGVVEAIRAEGMTPDAVTLASRKTDIALSLAKGIVGAMFIALYAAMLTGFWRRRWETEGEAVFSFAVPLIGALLLLSPTLHPWYVLWLLPFLTVRPNRAWLLFTGTVMLSYWAVFKYATEGTWQESNIVKLVEYVPFYFLLIYDGWQRIHNSASTEAEA